jgi:hypothetical protein
LLRALFGDNHWLTEAGLEARNKIQSAITILEGDYGYDFPPELDILPMSWPYKPDLPDDGAELYPLAVFRRRPPGPVGVQTLRLFLVVSNGQVERNRLVYTLATDENYGGASDAQANPQILELPG